jgi:hypothetical protein
MGILIIVESNLLGILIGVTLFKWKRETSIMLNLS